MTGVRAPRTARRFDGIERSATVALHDLVQRMRAAGETVLDLGGGQPDFDTPEHVTAEGVAALRSGFTRYTASRGLPELRAAIAATSLSDSGIRLDPDTDVIVTPSAKHALFVAMLTVLDPGDEILLPAPGWVSYSSMARLVGARPAPVESSAGNGFRLTRELLAAHVTERTRALLVNTPNNPTGHVLDEAEAAVVAEFAAEHDLVVLADEIYQHIVFDRPHLSLGARPDLAERTLTVSGFSKTYAMTGWRLGWLAGPPDLIATAVKAQEHTVSCASSFAQRAGVVALTGPDDFVRDALAVYRRRRDRVVRALSATPGVRCAAPDGAFYVFPDVRGWGFADSTEAATWLLRTAGVAVVPGTAFGPGGVHHLRISFAAADPVLDDALHRIAEAAATRTTG